MLQTFNSLLIFLCLGAPGFLSVHVWDSMVTRSKPEASYLSLRSLAYSTAYWALAIAVGLGISAYRGRMGTVDSVLRALVNAPTEIPGGLEGSSVAAYGLGAMTAVVLVPPVLTYGLARLVIRYPRLPAVLGLPMLAPTAWDYMFSGLPPCFVRVTLTDGKLIGGVWARASYATSYPDTKDLYLQKMWSIRENGQLDAPIDHNIGVWITESQIAYLEILENTTPDAPALGMPRKLAAALERFVTLTFSRWWGTLIKDAPKDVELINGPSGDANESRKPESPPQ